MADMMEILEWLEIILVEVEALRDKAIINSQDEFNGRAFEFLAAFQREKI